LIVLNIQISVNTLSALQFTHNIPYSHI